MMNDEIDLNDIANELLILNKYTIDTLFKLDNCSDCIALYVFYYKTAKWQKTNTIKANDTYIKKSLKWGEDKIRRTKKILKENGLIEIVQSRKDGKINGWYIKVSYLVKQKNIDDIKIKIDNINNTQNQELAKSTTSIEDINALKEYIKCLEKEIEMLKKNKNDNFSKKDLENEFNELWSLYPKKQGKKKALDKYIQCIKNNITNYEIVKQGIINYNRHIEKNKVSSKYIKQGSTWFNNECWNDQYDIEPQKQLIQRNFEEEFGEIVDDIDF